MKFLVLVGVVVVCVCVVVWSLIVLTRVRLSSDQVTVLPLGVVVAV